MKTRDDLVREIEECDARANEAVEALDMGLGLPDTFDLINRMRAKSALARFFLREIDRIA